MGITSSIQERLDAARQLIEQAEKFPLPEHNRSSNRAGEQYNQEVNDLIYKAKSLIRLIPNMGSASEEDKLETETLLDWGERVRRQSGEHKI